MEAVNQPLRFREKLGYGLGDAASNFFFTTFNIFLLFYYTDIFGLTVAAAGTMFLITKIIDAVSDPIMGLIADRTNSRWGKFRPYLLWGAVPLGVSVYAMFANPDLSESGKLIYAYVTYSLMMLAYTAVNVPYLALLGVISPVSIERTKVTSYQFFCAFTAGWLVVTFMTPLMDILGDGEDSDGFRLVMSILAVISVAFFWITFATTRERVPPPQVKPNILPDIKILLRNRPWSILFLAGLFMPIGISIRNGTLLYYFKYYVGDDGAAVFLIFDQTALFMSLGILSMMASVPLTKTLSSRFEKRTLMIILAALNALSTVVFYFIAPDKYWLMVAINCAGCLALGPFLPLFWSMCADCSDHGKWTTGRRTTALVFSTVQFAQKIGLALGVGLIGLVLAWSGFIANEVQTPAAINGIRAIFSLMPAAFTMLTIAVIYFYSIDSKLLERMEQEL